jgi:hypothetical protein
MSNFKGVNSIKEMYLDYHKQSGFDNFVQQNSIAKCVYDNVIKLQPYVKESQWLYTGGGCYHYFLLLTNNSIININNEDCVCYSANNWESINDYIYSEEEDGVIRWGFETDGVDGFSSCVNDTEHLQDRFKMFLDNLVTNIECTTDKQVAEKPKAYFLFGSDAVSEFEENGVDGVLSSYEDNELGYNTYTWVQGESTPQDLLYAFSGMYDFATITEEEFNKLN